ncbi:MAG TPA: efflux RND transporter permease subunit, partial [Thermoanaerobacterales bacterium]|nr:efflux RND transporter permease subunit [Thermoanaerobacterales bacterium]
MSLPSFSIKRPVTTIMAVIIIIILGFVSLGKTNIDLLPDVEFPIAVVITTYPGATSEEVESMVTKPVEKMISSAENIKSITSTSDPNVSVIEVTFNWGVDLDIATMELREKLDLAKKTLPDGADEPVVSKMDPSLMPALVVGLLGDRSDTLLKQIAEDEIVKPIERLEGVSAVRIVGGVERQIRVFLMPDKMEGYGISINQVTETLKLQNMSIPGGSVDYGGRELLVRTSGEFEDVDEIKNLIVANRQGAIVYLKDIAEVKDGTEDRNTYARINEKQGLRILIQKQSDANTVRVAETVKKELDKIEKRLPGDIEMYEILDQSDFINRAINTVKSNAIQGAILAIIIIFVFLHNIRSTLIIAVSIPISIIATFVIMYFMGISLNLMSLGGLAVGVGMLVDNTIVVLENVYRHQQLGKGRVEAAEVGASEVSLAIAASTLTTIAVFLPIVFIEGITKTLFKELSLTITFSLV